MSDKVYWRGEKPVCDFCQHDRHFNNVFYDAATTLGPWACMCAMHFATIGRAFGQKYEKEGDQWVKVRDLHK